MMRAQRPNESHSRSSRKGETQRHSASSGMRKRRSKAMRAPQRHVRREVGAGIRLPADHDEIAGEVAEKDAALEKILINKKKGARTTQKGMGQIKNN